MLTIDILVRFLKAADDMMKDGGSKGPLQQKAPPQQKSIPKENAKYEAPLKSE